MSRRRACQGTNGRGEPCKADLNLVDQDIGFCPAHAPGGQEEMERRAVRGGRATKEAWRRPGVTEEELGTLETVEDAKRWLRVIAGGVVSGKLDKGDAGAATRALEAWLKADDSLTEADMKRLAEKIAELKGQRGPLRRVG